MLIEIQQLPDELLAIILSYHPYFFTYKREYIKTTILDEDYHRDDIINSIIYSNLIKRYHLCYSRLELCKSIMSYNVFIYFETDNTENDCELIL